MPASRPKTTKFIFVTGGVLSGLGKGITAASVGNIFKARGFKVNIQKCDPYLNVDAGTLNPAEHGECFVTADGAETDLDVGHYERFMDTELTAASSLMSGRLLREVIEAERSGRYLGKTVQIIPHVTDHIQRSIASAARGFDLHIVEIGGTIGDYESLSFIEAIREMSLKLDRRDCLFIHVVYLPYLGASGEFKTKPAQNAVRDLRGLGIVPDILVARSELMPPKSVLPKLSLFSGLPAKSIVLLPNARTIYQVPLDLEAAGIGGVISAKLGLAARRADLSGWRRLAARALADHPRQIKIGIVAKYVDNQDTYMSVFEALRAAGWAGGVQVNIEWLNAEKLAKEKTERDKMKKLDGVIVPGGFGKRGIEGKIFAATYALRNRLPYLGLCLGLQVALVAAARLAGHPKANSTEFNPRTLDPVVSTMAEQLGKENTGGTMRLGSYQCLLQKDSLAYRLYRRRSVTERHRHRYEANNKYRRSYRRWGLLASGLSPDGKLVEMIEAIGHPFFIATQAHPEFRSRPNRPHPLFKGLVEAGVKRQAN